MSWRRIGTSRFYDNITNTNRRLQLVYPGEDDADPTAVSVLSPLGAALIGLSVGVAFDWCNVYGDRHSVPYFGFDC